MHSFGSAGNKKKEWAAARLASLLKDQRDLGMWRCGLAIALKNIIQELDEKKDVEILAAMRDIDPDHEDLRSDRICAKICAISAAGDVNKKKVERLRIAAIELSKATA